MADLSGLTRALTSGLLGYQRGQGQRQQFEREQSERQRLLQRQALQDMLSQQLLQAQISGQQQLGAQRTQANQHAAEQARQEAEAAARLVQQFPDLAGLPPPAVIEAAKTRLTQRPTERNIDPLSEEGIQRAVGRARQIAAIPPRVGMEGGVGKVTEGERRAAALLTVGEDAYKQLGSARPPTAQEHALQRAPFGLGNPALPQDIQRQRQAGAQLYRSYLYIVSGATVNPDEALEAAQQFLPQFGDKPETLKQKAQARATMIRAMRQAAGRAALPDGETDEPVPPSRPSYRGSRFLPGGTGGR